MQSNSSSRRAMKALGLAALATLSACGGSSGGEGEVSTVFVAAGSDFGAAGTSPLAVNGDWLAFLADEASSAAQDLNNDGQPGIDQVAVVANVATRVELNLGVAASEVHWLGQELYLVVDEVADDFDHGGAPGATDLVLMHWNPGLSAPAFVATLERSSTPALVTVGASLFFSSDQLPVAATESSLFAITAAQPQTPRPVFTRDALEPRRLRLLGADEGLVFLALDETLEGDELNDDGLADDTHVLALLDGTGTVEAGGYSLLARNTGLALSGSDTPLRASNQGPHDWLVGVLVDEAAQGVNLNVFDGVTLPTAWQVPACAPMADTDQLDQVLHVLRYAAWDLDPVGQAPINTGLAGSQRIVAADDAMGTLCLEADQNDCVLNGDGDADDTILRWIRIDSATFPYSTAGPVRAVEQLLALDVGLPGGLDGVAELDGAFVMQCDEVADGRSHDGDTSATRELLGWLDPQDALPAWTFDHGVGTPSYTTATWMAAQPDEQILGIAFAESSNGDDLNSDGDLLDSMPTWPALIGTPRALTFLGKFLAADADNAGITLGNGHGFFRFSEADNGNVDANANGNATDVLLVRVSFNNGAATNMGILNTLARPAIEAEPDGLSDAGAFLFDESFIGSDLNGDGDSADLVPRYFLMP